MSHKNQNVTRISPDIDIQPTPNVRRPRVNKVRRNLALVSLAGVGAASGLAGLATGAAHNRAPDRPDPTESPTFKHLEQIGEQFPDVSKVELDETHPGLARVTFKFSKDHPYVSDIYGIISPNQVLGDEVQTYPNNPYITHIGDQATFDVDLKTGLIVNNPDAPNSADTSP